MGLVLDRRPFLALKHYSQDFSIRRLDFGSDVANAIFDWFNSNTKPVEHHIGTLFTGAFYYDTCFWPIEIFLAYGTVHLEGLPSLQSMPESLKKEMMLVPMDAWSYAIAWAHSLDYAYGCDDMRQTLSAESSYAFKLLENADRELKSATAQLLEPQPNSKAAMSCRMATEIFLKAFLVLKARLTEKEIRAFSHNLNKSLAKIRELYPEHQILAVESVISGFPTIDDRYTGEMLSHDSLWEAYCTTMHVASSVTRSFTNRNALEVILKQNKIVHRN